MSHASPTQPVEQPDHYRRKRRPVNCEQCRRSKLRCDRQCPCGSCKSRGREAGCSYEARPPLSFSGKAHRPIVTGCSSLGRGNKNQRPSASSRQNCISVTPPEPGLTRCEPNQTPLDTNWEIAFERPPPEADAHNTLSPLSMLSCIPVQQIIDSLPSKPCCDFLISHFFQIISPLFPILHGPTFQRKYTEFVQRPHEAELPWLALLLAVCSLALHTMDETDHRLADIWSKLPLSSTQGSAIASESRILLRYAVTCLLQDGLFINHKFSTFEALLMVIYNLSHNESVDQGWGLLGIALNMGIALRCNVDQKLNPVEDERRRRCWTGLLTLHTYQGILFRDVDMSYLLNIKASLPTDVNDADITEEGILQPSHRVQPTQMSLFLSKYRLFQLSSQICVHISSPSRLDRHCLQKFDAAISKEQQQWDSTYLIDGSLSILDPTSYAFWCVLQTFAHHLYLLLHRPFHLSGLAEFLPSSRETCIRSSRALISLHKQIYESPLLRSYRWLLNGVTSLKALHAAVALNSCLQDISSSPDHGYDVECLRGELESLSFRMKDISGRSNICSRAYGILCHLQ